MYVTAIMDDWESEYEEQGELCPCCIERTADFAQRQYAESLGVFDQTYESELHKRYVPLVQKLNAAMNPIKR
jgi:hypothetical protein